MLQSRATKRIAVGIRAHGSHWLLSSMLVGALPACAAQNIEPGAEVAGEAEALTVSPAASATLVNNALILKAVPIKKLVCSAPADGTRPEPTLVNTDPFVLSRFALDKVYKQLISTSGLGAPTSTQLYQQLWDSMDTAASGAFSAPHCDDNGSTINGFPIDCPRPETQLKKTLPSKFTPVALFNRFDLAASDGSNCGEYRIVYAMNATNGGGGYPGGLNPDLPIKQPPIVVDPNPPDPIGPIAINPRTLSLQTAGASASAVLNPAALSSAALKTSAISTTPIVIGPPIIIPPPPQPTINGRAFIIFEGILPNPRPSCGVEMCRPVVKFWENLAASDPNTAAGQQALADGLEEFYFKGIAGFEPVVHHLHYGAKGGGGGYGQKSGGQIRTNLFVDFVAWQLRESHLVTDCSSGTCKLVLAPVTVKTNPFHELFDDPASPGSPPSTAAFQSVFPAETKALSTDVVTEIGMFISDKFNGGQSTASDPGEDYEFQFNQGSPPNAFSAAIDGQLTAISRTDLTAADIARRATTQSCAGCHELSSGVKLGGNKNPTWPRSRRFVHVDESGFLSEALWCSFIPARKAKLDTFAASAPQVCPPISIKQPVRQTLILDPEVNVAELQKIDPAVLTISGKPIGPN